MRHPREKPVVRFVFIVNFERYEESALQSGGAEGNSLSERGQADSHGLLVRTDVNTVGSLQSDDLRTIRPKPA